MSELAGILNNLQNKLNEKKVQKLSAEKELEEINKQLKELNINSDDLEKIITEKSEEVKKLEKEIKQQIENIESELK